MAQQRVSSVGIEPSLTGTPNARVSSLGIEPSLTGTPNARVSSLGIEVAILTTPPTPSTLEPFIFVAGG